MGASASTAGSPSRISVNTSEPPSDDIDILGVKLSFIDALYDLCGGRNQLSNLTTAEVFTAYIKPLTTQYQLPLCQILNQENHPAVGIATVYVSHSWQCQFLDFVDALTNYVQEDRDIVLWIDLFSKNHCLDCSESLHLQKVETGISRLCSLVLVLPSLDSIATLQDSMCLFEVLVASNSSASFNIAMIASGGEALRDMLSDDATNTLRVLESAIVYEQSVASQSSIRHCINQWLAKHRTSSFDVNAKIWNLIQQWLVTFLVRSIATAQSMYDDEDSGSSRKNDSFGIIMNLKVTLGTIYIDLGQLSEAETVWKDVVEAAKLVFGTVHPSTVGYLGNLALIYNQQGKFTLSEPLFEECYQSTVALLGDDDASTFIALNNLASCYCDQQQFEKAGPLFERCYERRSIIMGVLDSSTMESMSNLVTLRRLQSDWQACITIWTNHLTQLQALEPPAPLTAKISAVHALANINLEFGEAEGYLSARQLLEDLLTEQLAVAGDSNEDTLRTMQLLGTICIVTRKFTRAEALLSQCCLRLQEVLGAEDPGTLEVVEQLDELRRLRPSQKQ